MKGRFSDPLVFLFPCAMIASIAGVTSVGVGAGVAWIFIYGDDSWPVAAERVIMAVSVPVAVASFAVLMSACYFYGKRRESSGGLSNRHATAAVATAILLPAVVLLRQYRIGAL